MARRKLQIILLLLAAIFFTGSEALARRTWLNEDAVRPALSFDGSLAIQAHLFYGDESEILAPLAGVRYYLLDRELISILQQIGLRPVDGENDKLLATEAAYLEATARALGFAGEPDEEGSLVSPVILKAISEHAAGEIKTDLSGKGRFRQIKTGRYFLFGIAKTETEALIWHQPIDVIPGANRIELDQYNADAVVAEIN